MASTTRSLSQPDPAQDPIAVVDSDLSELTRRIVQTLDASGAVSVAVRVDTLAEAAILVDADEPLAAIGYRDYEAPARALQIELRLLEVRGTNPDLDAAIKSALDWRAEALIIVTSVLLFSYRKAIAELALKWQLPTAFHGKDWVVAGGLMSYSADDLAAFRRVAHYIDRILKGARPPIFRWNSRRSFGWSSIRKLPEHSAYLFHWNCLRSPTKSSSRGDQAPCGEHQDSARLAALEGSAEPKIGVQGRAASVQNDPNRSLAGWRIPQRSEPPTLSSPMQSSPAHASHNA